MEELKQYNRAEREALVLKWRSSGLSKAAFCREHAIELKRFYGWSNPGRAQKKNQKLLGFKPVRGEDASAVSNLIHVQLPNGVQVKLPVCSEVDHVLSLLRGLACS